MLEDPRSKALLNNFVGQWLYLRNVQVVSPDPDRFPDFDENLRKAFQKETELLFESMLREDRSVVELLNADYTFLNERLARHYGIPNIYGSRFRRVKLTNEDRRGLLGHGGVLMVDLVCHKDFSGFARKMVAGKTYWAPRRRRRRQTFRLCKKRVRMESRPPCASGWHSTAQILCARVVTRKWTRWASRSKTLTQSASGELRTRAHPSMRPASFPTAASLRGPLGFGMCC